MTNESVYKGLMFYSFYFIFMFEALETATPVATSSIFTLMPFIAICLDRAFFAKRAGWSLLLSLPR